MTRKLGIAAAEMPKGAFDQYHPSKADVLEALLERRLTQWQGLITPIAESDASATERMRRVLQAIGVAKLRDSEFLVDSLRGLYADENILVHHRTRVSAAILLTPLLTTIIDAGTRTGEFLSEDAAASTTS